MGDTQVYIVEQSVVDPRAQIMQTRLKNITLQAYMTVDERCTWRTSPSTVEKPAAQRWTDIHAQAKISSGLGMGIAGMVERYGRQRFEYNMYKSRKGIESVLEALDLPSWRTGSKALPRLTAPLRTTACEDQADEGHGQSGGSPGLQ